MADSVTYSYDVAARALAYKRFGTILGIDQLGSTDVERINKGVVLCPRAIAERYVSEKRGETFLDFMNVYRRSIAFSWKRNRTVVSRRGLRYQKANGRTATIKADAVDLDYDVWAWSTSLDKINLCVEEYLRWQHETPKVQIVYESEFTLDPNLQFSSVVDDSRIESLYDMGKVWIFRMPIHIDGWLPKDAGAEVGRANKIQLTLYDRDDISSYEEIIVPGSDQNTELEAALRMFRASLYGIAEVDVVAKTFTIYDDRSSEFTVGDLILVRDSTDNDEQYTVVSAMYSSEDDTTVITVEESPISATADGHVYKIQ